MFGLGFWEIAIILAVALLVLGPSKLPELAKGLGKGLREFRKATEDFKSTIEDEAYRPDPPKQVAAQQPVVVPPVPQEIAPPPAAVVAAEPIKDAALPSPDGPKSSTR